MKKLLVDTENNTITFNGIKISIEVLEAMTQLGRSCLYRFERHGDQVFIFAHEGVEYYASTETIQ